MKQLVTMILLLTIFVTNAQLPDRPLQRGEKQEYVELEGYYGKGFEYSVFYPFKNGKLQDAKMWVHFSDDIYATDSLDYLTKGKSTPSYHHGVYMKVRGMRKWGDKNGYGHMGYGNSQIIIDTIFEIDTLRTRWQHIIGNIIEKGYYKNGRTKVTLPLILKSDSEHLYVGSDDNFKYELRMKSENGSTIEYKLITLENTVKVSEITDIKYIKLFELLFLADYPEESYTIAEYAGVQGRGSSISFLKEKEDGKQVIEFSVPSSDPYQPLVKFYEVKP